MLNDIFVFLFKIFKAITSVQESKDNENDVGDIHKNHMLVDDEIKQAEISNENQWIAEVYTHPISYLGRSVIAS